MLPNLSKKNIFSASQQSLLKDPDYLKIISQGEKALPLIFKSLKKKPDHWFIALATITKANPVKPKNQGNLNAMTKDWLEWGRQQGYTT